MLRPYRFFCHVTQTAVIDAATHRESAWLVLSHRTTKKTRCDANFSQAHGMRVSLKCLPNSMRVAFRHAKETSSCAIFTVW